MFFLVDDELFAATENSLFLSTFVGQCILRDHRWLPVQKTSLNPGPHFASWLQQRSNIERQAIENLQEFSLELETTEPARKVCCVLDNESNWSNSTPRLTLTDAIFLASSPYQIMLEGLTNDRHFLLACADPVQKRKLRELERKGLVEYINGGGLNSMVNFLENLPSRKRLLVWVIFDSDSLIPGTPSKDSEKFSEYCQLQRVEYHRLQRRTIENYLTVEALGKWPGKVSQRDKIELRSKIFKAWKSLRKEQRQHFPMKKGFAGDMQRINQLNGDDKEEYGKFWNGTPFDGDLAVGFGKDIANLFVECEQEINSTALRRDGILDELSPVLEKLMVWLR